MKWINFLIYMFTMAYTPGPNNLASMANMARVGFKKGIIFNLGILTSQLIIMALCVTLCNTISNLIPVIQLPLKICGSLYILYLSWKTLNSKGPEDKETQDGTFLSGFILNSLNVKYMIFCIVTLQTFIIPGTSGNWGSVIGISVIATLIAFSSHVSWGLFGVAIRDFYKKHVKVVNIVLSILLLYCVIAIFLK